LDFSVKVHDFKNRNTFFLPKGTPVLLQPLLRSHGQAGFAQRIFAFGGSRSDTCISLLGRHYPVKLKIKNHMTLEKKWNSFPGTWIKSELPKTGWCFLTETLKSLEKKKY
jgi:hypothetical protein